MRDAAKMTFHGSVICDVLDGSLGLKVFALAIKRLTVLYPDLAKFPADAFLAKAKK